jgi:hypothetical protein
MDTPAVSRIVSIIKEKVDENNQDAFDFLLLDPTDSELWSHLDNSVFDREVLEHVG